MFKSPESRVVLRGALVFVGATLASLAQATYGSDLTAGEAIFALSTGFSTGLAISGIEFASKTVNPAVGKV